MFCMFWDYSNANKKDKHYKQKTSPKIYKNKSKFSLILG